jgi:RHS repeat-associated protein
MPLHHIRRVLQCLLALWLASSALDAKYIGADAAKCNACEACAASPRCSCGSPSGLSLSFTEGNLSDSLRGPAVQGNHSAALALSFIYNSYNADGSRAALDVGMGYGWTHSYNVFLFSQRGHMFRMDGEGRAAKFTASGGAFRASPGYFETLVRNPDGSFTLTQKDGTIFHFAQVPGTWFLVGGPVWRLISITDRNGNVTSLTYNAGNLTRVANAYFRGFDFTYDTRNHLTSITDPDGGVTRFTYDPTGRQLRSIADAAGKIMQYTYNILYQVVSKIDRDGRTFSVSYRANLPVGIRDGSGASLVSLSNPVNWATNADALAANLTREYVPTTTTMTDGRGFLWRYEYDVRGYVTRRTAPDGAVTVYAYDPATLRLASHTDAHGHVTRYEYDARGNVIRFIDAAGNATVYTYEPLFNRTTSITDPNGRTTTYDYDSEGNLIRQTDPLGGVNRWTYDARGNILSETDERAGVTQYQYDAFGNQVRIIDAFGNAVVQAYDARGNLTQRTDRLGRVTTYQHDALNRLIVQVDALGGVTRYVYDGEGHRTQVIKPNGAVTSFLYDLRGRMIRQIDPLGHASDYVYDGNDNRISTRDPLGRVTTFAYDAHNRLIRTVNALGGAQTKTYDAGGNLIRQTDENGRLTQYQYDALHRLVRKIDAAGFVTVYAYDGVGLPGCPACTGPKRGSDLVTRQTDGNGKVTYSKYDGLDRLIITIRKEGDTLDAIDGSDAVTRYTYDPAGNRLTLTEPNGKLIQAQYDALNRLSRLINAAGEATLHEYDAESNHVAVNAPNGNRTTYVYDALNRVIAEEDREGLIVRYSYDAVGNRVTKADGLGNTWRYVYDLRNQLVSETDAQGQTAHFFYDAVGNQIRKIDREGRTTLYGYDQLNRRTTITGALGHATAFQYDAASNLIRVTDANGRATTYAYDGLNRRIRETFADPAPNTRSYTYNALGYMLTRVDQAGRTTTFTYNDLYFLTRRTYPTGADQFTYDLSGRMLTALRGGWLVAFSYDGADRILQTAQNGKIVSYVYNVPGRTIAINYPGGRTVMQHQDFRKRLVRVEDGAPVPLALYAYDAADRATARTYRNGVAAAYSYSPNGWPLSIEHARGSARVAGFGYVYDREGNPLVEQKRHDTSASQTYAYDAIDRLVAHRTGLLAGTNIPAPVTQTAYSLDPLSNWNSKTTDGVTETRTHNEANEITAIDGVPILHDANGNSQQDAAFRYFYDEEDRLTRVERRSDSVAIARFEYDALGRRVKKFNVAGAETRFYYDHERLIEEATAAGSTLATYVHGQEADELLSLDRGGQSYFYHQNAQLSTHALTNSAGAVAEGLRYDPYGGHTLLLPGPNGTVDFGGDDVVSAAGVSSAGNPLLFTGQRLDAETGIYHFKRRYYSTTFGRFLSRDPLGYADRYNLYEYARSNPMKFRDPTGMLSIWMLQKKLSPEAKCADVHFVKYEYELDADAPCDGYVIQKVVQTGFALKCGDVLSNANLDGTYFESLGEIAEKKRGPVGDKVELEADDGTRGRYRQTGEAKFYCKNASPGRNHTGVLDWKPGDDPNRPDPIPEAGTLPATRAEPGWWSQAAVEGPANRSFEVKWCCCPDPPKTAESSATPLRQKGDPPPPPPPLEDE